MPACFTGPVDVELQNGATTIDQHLRRSVCGQVPIAPKILRSRFLIVGVQHHGEISGWCVQHCQLIRIGLHVNAVS